MQANKGAWRCQVALEWSIVLAFIAAKINVFCLTIVPVGSRNPLHCSTNDMPIQKKDEKVGWCCG